MTTVLRPHDDTRALAPDAPKPGGRRAGRRWWWAALATLGALAWAVLGTGGGRGVSAAPPLAPLPAQTGAGTVEGDGRVDGLDLTVDDTWHAALANLDPALLDAVAAASADASTDGIEVLVRSGWRSREYQQELLDDAVQKYGSLDEALRWVASPDTSRHVVGAAVDVGATDAAYWMAEHGSAYGLCQAYANEIWHYELLTTPGGVCPEPRADGAS